MATDQYEDGSNEAIHSFGKVFKNLLYVSFPIFI